MIDSSSELMKSCIAGAQSIPLPLMTFLSKLCTDGVYFADDYLYTIEKESFVTVTFRFFIGSLWVKPQAATWRLGCVRDGGWEEKQRQKHTQPHTRLRAGSRRNTLRTKQMMSLQKETSAPKETSTD
jgi:hypothetical protein